jgi:hypothetical protein
MKTNFPYVLFFLGILLVIPGILFAQSSITVGAGPPYVDGFTVNNSDRIIFGFDCDPVGVGDVDIPMLIPASGSDFDIIKNSLPCPTDSPPGCYGSLVMYPESDAGSFTVSGGSSGSFVITVDAPVTPGTGDWMIDPPTNADIQFIRAIPDIQVVPLDVVSGKPGITIDASITVPVYAGSISPAPSIVSYSWVYTGSVPGVVLANDTTSTPSFDAPAVTEDTELTFDLTVVDNAGLSATEEIIIPIKPPIDSVLLMDTSGSMGWYHDGSTHNLAGGCCSRLASAKAAANYFVDRLSVLTDDSRLGVAIFPFEPAPSTEYGGEWTPLTALTGAAAVTSIQGDIGGESGGDAGECADCSSAPTNPGVPTGIQVNWNSTPTRHGLDAAYDMFPITSGADDFRTRTIVLLSDGAWNLGDDPADLGYLDTYFVDNGIRIYTIGMGTGSDNVNHDSLQNISIGTGVGEAGSPLGFTTYNLGDTSEPNLFPFVEKIMGDMASLDFIADPPHTIKPGKSNKHKLYISNHDNLLSLTVSWESSSEGVLDFYVLTPYKDKLKPQVSGAGYRNLTIDRRNKEKRANGAYTLVVTSSKANRKKRNKGIITYNYSVITKSYLNMDVYLNKDKYYTGDLMKVEARLIENNIRFKGKAKVVMEVTRPETGIGDWYRKNSVSEKDLKKIPDILTKENLSPLEKKKFILIKEKRKTLPRNVKDPKVTLYDNGKFGDKKAGDGIYTGVFKGIKIQGIYRFRIAAEGVARNGERFQRETEIQKYVDIRPDYKNTIIEGVLVKDRRGKGGIIGIRVTPVDSLKNHLGPGYADEIRIKVKGCTPEGNVEDRLDGTYEQLFKVDNVRKNPRVTVSVRGVKVYDGPFSKIKKGR